MPNETAKPDLKVVPGSDQALSTSDAARRAKRETMEWISEAFDVSTGRYRGGVNDASIAKETGLAESAVAALREEFFGPLRLPSELEAARGELAAVRKSIADLEQEWSDKIGNLENRVKTVSSRIGELIRKNGWKE